MKKLSKGLYLGSIIGGSVGGGSVYMVAILLVVFTGVASWRSGNFNFGGLAGSIVFLLLGLALLVYGAVFSYMLLYKAWQSIQDGQARTTPGKAVGFMFIPFFNLYWVFMAYWGFAQDYNGHIQRRGLNVPTLSVGMFLAYPILVVASLIPYLGGLAALPLFIIFIIISNSMIDAVNRLSETQSAPAVA